MFSLRSQEKLYRFGVGKKNEFLLSFLTEEVYLAFIFNFML